MACSGHASVEAVFRNDLLVLSALTVLVLLLVGMVGAQVHQLLLTRTKGQVQTERPRCIHPSERVRALQ